MMRSTSLKIVFLISTLLTLVLPASYYLLTPRIHFANNSSQHNLSPNKLWLKILLMKSGYTDTTQKFSITYSDDIQETFALMHPDQSEYLSISTSNNNDQIDLTIRYNPQHFQEISDVPNWFDLDIFTGICLASGKMGTDWNKCRENAKEIIYWGELQGIPPIVKQQKSLFSFRLVSQAYAQACYGTIPCGRTEYACTCSITTDRRCETQNCPPGETCNCTNNCNFSLGVNLSCYGNLTTQTACNNSTASLCAIGCNASPESYCSWSSVPSPTAPPSTPGCTVSALAPEPFSCYGLAGTMLELGTRPTWSGNTCGPTASNPAGTCGWWTGYWTGWFHAPAAGNYDFLIDAMPQGGMWIDLNQDLIDPQNCGGGPLSQAGYGNGAVPVLGNKYVWQNTGACNSIYRPKWLSMLISGIDSWPSCGAAGCDCWKDGVIGDACDEGRHCNEVDRNISGTSSPYSVTGYPQIPPFDTPALYQTTNQECIYNSRGPYLIGFDNKGTQLIYASRNFPAAGDYKVGFWYNYNVGSSSNTTSHNMKMWYRPPGQTGFTKLTGPTSAGGLDNSPSCPFTNCPVPACTPAPPAAPALTIPDDGYRMFGTQIQTLNWTMGSFGTACPTNTNALKLFYGTNSSAVTNAVYTTTTGIGITAVPLTSSTLTYTINILPATGQQYFWKVMASNGNQTSSSPRWSFYAPTAADVVFERSSDCPPSAPSSLAGTGFTASFQLKPTGYTAYSGSVTESNPTRLNLIPSNTSYLVQNITPGGDWKVTCYPAVPAFTTPKLDPNSIKVYVEKSAKPWFQIVSGDVGSANDSISTEVPYNNSFLMPLSGASSGVAIARDSVNVISPLWPTDREWTAEAVNLNDFANGGSWYEYFERTFEQPVDSEDVFIGPAFMSDSNFEREFNWTEHNEEANSYVLYVNGLLTIDGDLTINNGNKYTVFVQGDLNVEAKDINVVAGSFLGFVVTGDINFEDTTEEIDGVYISDRNIIIESNNPLADAQFVGNGIFAGKLGVSLDRDLDPDSNTLANNLNPAEQFTYRPDFLYNAPLGFKRIPLSWQEVEPGTINLTE